MAITRLGLTGTPAAGYAGFAPKAPAVTGRADLTRLVGLGIGWARGAGFVAKTPAGESGADDLGWVPIWRRRRRHRGRTWR